VTRIPALVLFQTLILLTLAEGAARIAEWLRPRHEYAIEVTKTLAES
jgi:hypothetical protein